MKSQQWSWNTPSASSLEDGYFPVLTMKERGIVCVYAQTKRKNGQVRRGLASHFALLWSIGHLGTKRSKIAGHAVGRLCI